MIERMKTKIPSIPYYLFYLGLTIELIVVLVERSVMPLLYEGEIFRVTFALFALKICFTKYTKKEWMWLIAFSIMTFIMYRITGQNVALRAVFFVAAMRGINIKEAMKFTLWITLSGLLITIALSFMGIGRDIKSTEVFRETVETRYHFGVGHPNTFFCIILVLLLLFFYCYKERITKPVLISFAAIIFVLFLFTDSRTGFAVTIFAMLCAALYCLFPKIQRTNWIYYIGITIFLFCIGISVWAAANSINAWHDPIVAQIDRIFSGRIKVLYFDNIRNAGSLGTWTLFSSPESFIASHYFDMGWVRVFYWFGVIPGLVICLVHLLLLNECRRQKDYMALALVTVTAIYTIVEPQFISFYLGRNILLFLFGLYWGQMFFADGDEVNWWRIIR